TRIIGSGAVIRTATIFFYISNEGVSILENVSKIGLPKQNKLQEVLEQIKDRSGDDDADN
ncbi:MAG: phage holin family protein, partial [Lachnospirales bacterium]